MKTLTSAGPEASAIGRLRIRMLQVFCRAAYCWLPTVQVQAEVDLVPFSEVPRPPRIEATWREWNDGLRLDAKGTNQDGRMGVIEAELVATAGSAQAQLTRIGPGSWMLSGSKAASVSIRLQGEENGTRFATESIIRYGNLRPLVDELSRRARLLDTNNLGISRTPVERNIRRDFRQWLDAWLSRMEASEDLTITDPSDGNTSRERLLASQLLEALEAEDGVRSMVAGRQLPGRNVFEVVGGNGRRTHAIDYVVRFPEEGEGESPPFLTIIHGTTSHPTISSAIRPELDSVAEEISFPFITVAPVFPGDMQEDYGWDPAWIVALVESLAADFSADPDRLYLTGFSLGGYGTVRTVAYRPDLFAAYASVCGDGDPAFGPRLATVPGYFYHGKEDTAVGMFRSLRFHDALHSAGGDPHLWIYEGVGHPVWSHVYRDPAFYGRLLQHRRESREIPLVAQMPSGAWESKSLPAREHKVYWASGFAPGIAEVSDRQRLTHLIREVFRGLPTSLQHGQAVFSVMDESEGGPTTFRVGVLVDASEEPMAERRPETIVIQGPARWLVDELNLQQIDSALVRYSGEMKSAIAPESEGTGVLLVVDYLGLRKDSRIWLSRFQSLSETAIHPQG